MTLLSVDSPSRTLGVLGGLGPAAGAQFLADLAAAVPADRDQQHPRVVMLSDPRVPDRNAALLAGSDAPLAPLRDGLQTLISWGAELLAVPCNTAHAFIDRFADELSVPLVHIVDATVTSAARVSPDGTWLLATRGTIASGMYQRRAATAGLPMLIPPDDVQQLLDRSIAAVKGRDLGAGAASLSRAVQRLWTIADVAVCGACTELPLAYDAAGLPAARSISSLLALAYACVTAIYAQPAIGP